MRREKRMSRAQQKAFYTSRAWRRARIVALERSGWLCEECRREGITTGARIVHHRHPLESGGAALPGETGLSALCFRHHETAHGRAPGGSRASEGRFREQHAEWQRYIKQVVERQW